jgi:peptidoglycan/LPS O-acetylase OafA/YrhL
MVFASRRDVHWAAVSSSIPSIAPAIDFDTGLGLFSATGLFFLFAMHQWQAQVLWTYAFVVIVFAFAATFPGLFRGTWISNFFADISYPLYVIHGVAGYASMRVLMDLGAPAWVTLALVTAGALSLAWVLHIAVEKPTQQLGKRITAV